MKISFNTAYYYNGVSMRQGAEKNSAAKTNNLGKDVKSLLEPISQDKTATIPPYKLMRGINPNKGDVFDCFNKIDDVTREINFVRTQKAWDDCLLEEIQEFQVARREYELDKSQQNFDHMEEEMGDIFYTAASISKDSGIDPKEAFKSTNRKFVNRINLMERICAYETTRFPEQLKDCSDYERRALWNAVKRKLYDAQAKQY